MKENNQDILARAYSILQGLRQNIPDLQWPFVEEKYVTEYHNALDTLEHIGIDVNQFRIPSSEIQPRIPPQIYISYRGSGEPSPPPKYSKEKYVPKELLLAKMDAILIYFEITSSEKPRKIGFSPPDKL